MGLSELPDDTPYVSEPLKEIEWAGPRDRSLQMSPCMASAVAKRFSLEAFSFDQCYVMASCRA